MPRGLSPPSVIVYLFVFYFMLKNGGHLGFGCHLGFLMVEIDR